MDSLYHTEWKSTKSEDLFSISDIWEILNQNTIWLVDGATPFEETAKTVKLSKLTKKAFKELFI